MNYSPEQALDFDLAMCRHVDLSEREYQRKYVLIDAAQRGNVVELERFIGMGYDVNQRDPFQKTALFKVIEAYQKRPSDKLLEIITVLLENDADPTVADYKGKYFLTSVVRTAPYETLVLTHSFCEAIWKSSERNNQMLQALIAAVQCDFTKVLSFLLSKIDMSYNITDSIFRLLTINALINCKRHEILDIILENAQRNNVYEDTLKLTVQNLEEKSVKLITHKLAYYLTENPSVDMVSEIATGFYKSVSFRSTKVALTIIQANWCNIPYRPGDIEPPYFVAISCNNVAIISAVVTSGLPISQPAAKEIMSRSCYVNNPEARKWLLTATSNPFSLACLCRAHIRKLLGIKLVAQVDSLPIPNLLKDYVLMDDIPGYLHSKASAFPLPPVPRHN